VTNRLSLLFLGRSRCAFGMAVCIAGRLSNGMFGGCD
jgi:hypothetical protein